MKKRFLLRVLPGIALCTSCFLCVVAQAPVPSRDGKLLEGESWLPFSYPKEADFYVSPNGNDQWSGMRATPNVDGTDGPFRTIERAQKAVRQLKSKVFKAKDIPVQSAYIGSPHPLGSGRDILVYIRGGMYSLNKPLLFEPADGGERVETNLPTGAFEYHKLRDHYVTYAAYPGETPVITSAQPVKDWKKKGKIWTAGFDADSVGMLIVNEKKQVLARLPNSDYLIPPVISSSPGELHFRKGELKDWQGMEGNRVVMLLRWHTGINSFSRIDETSGIATLRLPQEGITIVPPRYYVENVKSLLDTAGEWFFDKKLKELSYIPPAKIKNINQVYAGVPRMTNLISVQGQLGQPVRNLRFYGLRFQGTLGSGSAIRYEYAHACELVDGDIRSCGGNAVSIQKGCYQIRILRNHIEAVDEGAIVVKGPVQPADGREIIRETQISYNQLSDCGGINIHASYSLMTTISHNYITKTRGRFAIYVGGWANIEEAIDGGYLVAYNHLEDVQQDADDSGAITTAGVTFNSVVRRNLIHNVNAGFFNDNVAFWFDNMSNGWTCKENIYYELQQGEWKLCAALIEDNKYQDNFTIDAPVNKPELIIDGEPQFKESNLEITAGSKTISGAILTGSLIRIKASVFNKGATGVAPVLLYVDGKIKESRLFPVVKGNSREIEFELRLYEEGVHDLAIGSTAYTSVRVEGEKPEVVFEEFKVSNNRLFRSEKVTATAIARNLTSNVQHVDASLILNNKEVQRKQVELKANGIQLVSFELEPGVGQHQLRIENSAQEGLQVIAGKFLNLVKLPLLQYASAKAKPYKIEADPKANRFVITAGGSDFFHAEDSYAAVYTKRIKGDFVATVTINRFGDRTHEWFRAGLFVRNDMTKSFDVQPGSKGSVLVFATPGRAGINYDEFGNGCMHKASSTNLPENIHTPIYLKMVRHGNSFSGYISLDGKTWLVERHTPDIPDIDEEIDLGLAAGSPDKLQYRVEFADWKIEVAE
ncbi:MAG TPA: DUF1349 domain-containing protein [Agriterribacter sp.]|nr:DUF1349 domain-containing protein [Agriterribacter sp.]